MRNRFDQLAKQIGQEALRPSGKTVAHDEINAETQYADLRHEPDPARGDERARLGLLGRLAAVCCLIEVYSQAPDAEEFRACLAKHLASWQRRARKARVENRKQAERSPGEPAVDSYLWIIAAGSPSRLLAKLKLEPAPGWPAGVYFFGDDVLRVGIVVASELPRDSTTLLVRLMAAGPLLVPAARELAALPRDAHERAVAEPILLELKQAIERQSRRTPDEEKLLVSLYETWVAEREQMRSEATREGRAEGHTEGRIESRMEAVLTVLRVRGIDVPEDARERIVAQKDPEQLTRWLERAAVASSISDVIDGPS